MLLIKRKFVFALLALLAVHNNVVVQAESVPTSPTSRNLVDNKSIKNIKNNTSHGMRGLRATRRQQEQLQQLLQQERALKSNKGIKGEKGGKTEFTAETTGGGGGGGGGKDSNKGGKNKNNNSYVVTNTNSGAATGVSQTQTQTTTTAASSQGTTTTATSESLSLIGPHGVAESVPCVAWTTVTRRQKADTATAPECASLNNGDYPYTGGCCRSYWWLIYDPTGLIHASLPCICNAFTRSPSEFGQASSTTSTTTATTTTEESPTNAPTPVPRKALTNAPTKAPTTVAPTRAPTKAALPTDDGQSLIALGTCETPQNNIFWNEVAFPELAQNAKCTYSQECMEQFGSDSCCLAAYCFCGNYQPGRAKEECVPIHYTANTGREVASGGTAGPPDSLQDLVDRTDDTAGVNNNDSQVVSVPTVSPTTIAPTPVSPTTASPTKPTTASPTQEPTTQLPVLTAPAPAPDTCAYTEKNIYWDARVYPQYESYTQCTTSSQCRRVPGACCLATFCLCGLYRPDRQVTDCLP